MKSSADPNDELMFSTCNTRSPVLNYLYLFRDLNSNQLQFMESRARQNKRHTLKDILSNGDMLCTNSQDLLIGLEAVTFNKMPEIEY